MEPTATKPAGRSGSLTNPEVVDVPGHVIPTIEKEFDDFDTEAGRFMRGEVQEEQFIGFRLKQGVYGQRQANVQMIRVKLPFGGVSPEQLEAFADVAEKYTPLSKGHITTRQNIQYHHVPLPDAAKAIRLLSEAGLSSREACGNTVRNVTGDPWAGVTDELYDITPYAGAFVRYFVRNEICQLLPRKFKVAFTANDEDRAITLIHDLGFLPRVREIDGREVKGVEIRTGGGTSIMARIGSTLYDFVEVENGDYLKVSEAVLRIFDRQDWLRANRQRARIKFLIDKIGIDEFRAQVDEEMKGDWVKERNFDPSLLLYQHDEEANAPLPPAVISTPNGDRSEFDRFLASNVKPQRQDGFVTVEVKVTRGDLTPEMFRGLAAITREYCGGYARTTIHQNLVLRWVREEAVYDVWKALAELGLGDYGASEVTDVLSCPGTDSCKMGITSSMGLNRAIQDRVESMGIEDPLTKGIHIKMSGCPNGCGQHHFGSIGFYGASMKMGGKQVPAYIAHVGGRYDGGELAYGQRVKVRLPAKRVPDAIERWIRLYEREREDGETFNGYVDRVGTEPFAAEAKELSLPVEFDLENIQQFIDWGRHEPYQVIRGEGECAVSAMAVAVAPDLESSSAEEVLRYAVDRHHPRLVVACSFQKEASVIMDMLLRIEPEARFFTIDTGVLFPETHETRQRLESRYGIEIETFDASNLDGRPWTGGSHCCSERKVAALGRALAGADAWVSGLRREHSPERADTAKFGWDERNERWKANPLADWTERDVWRYVAEHDVPYNELHDRGYDSIGCVPCTQPGQGRDGRWAGTDKSECGLHA